MIRLPDGSWDTHCHVFGPASRYPWAPERTYTPDEAPAEMLAAMHAMIGVRHAVIVHPACHGLDMRVTLDAIAASGGRHRGIALVEPDIGENELRRLHSGGIRGVRFNFARALGATPDPDAVLRLADRIAPLGWHAVFHFDPADLIEFDTLAARLPVPYVIDHMGRIRAEEGLDSAPFAALLSYATDERCWIKVSGGDRASSGTHGYADVEPFARAIIAAAPDRVLWGTDWPHPNIRGPMPQEADLVALFARFAPTEEGRRRILIENPQRLYGI